jgi:hypothetical protein
MRRALQMTSGARMSAWAMNGKRRDDHTHMVLKFAAALAAPGIGSRSRLRNPSMAIAELGDRDRPKTVEWQSPRTVHCGLGGLTGAGAGVSYDDKTCKADKIVGARPCCGGSPSGSTYRLVCMALTKTDTCF